MQTNILGLLDNEYLLTNPIELIIQLNDQKNQPFQQINQ